MPFHALKVIRRMLHEMNERHPPARTGLAAIASVRWRNGGDGFFQRHGIVAADVKHGAKGHGLLDARLPAKLLGEVEQDPGR